MLVRKILKIERFIAYKFYQYRVFGKPVTDRLPIEFLKCLYQLHLRYSSKVCFQLFPLSLPLLKLLLIQCWVLFGWAFEDVLSNLHANICQFMEFRSQFWMTTTENSFLLNRQSFYSDG